MGFVDELYKASLGHSGIYGEVAPDNEDHISQILQARKRMQEDDLNTFKNKASFMNDMSMRQNPMQRIFNPGNDGMNSQAPRNGLAGIGAPAVGNIQNTRFVEDPDRITPFQQAGLNIRRDENTVDRERIAQQGRLGDAALGIRQQQTDLNQQKSDQINALKQTDMQRKIEEANNKIEFANKKLEQAGSNAAAQLEAHKSMRDAVEERHKLELEHKDKTFEETKRMHDEQIKALQEKYDQSGNSETTTEVDENGKKKTVITKKGSKKQDNNDPLGIRK